MLRCQLLILDEALRKSDGTVKSFRCKARKSDGMRRTYLYATMTEDAAQHSRWAFYEAVILCIPIIFCILLILSGTGHAADKPSTEVYWPVDPIHGSVGSKHSSSLNEPIYKRAKRIWPDLPYTDNEVRAKALKGFLWMIKYMNTNGHLEGNENNYLTMLGTMFNTARDPYFRRVAWEEARGVINNLIKSDFFNREDDVSSLLEYLMLFNRFGMTDSKIEEITFQKLEKEKQKIIDGFQKLKNTSVDADELYDTMLLTYYFTNLKKKFPRLGILENLPDLRDFFEILAQYKYHLEEVETPDYSKLTADDISKITDDLYNVTHVIFVVCDYNFYKAPKKYFPRELDYMLKYADLICSRYHNDPDLLTEVVYALSIMGYPKSHEVIKKSWIKILAAQREDGSWEAYGIDDNESAYDKHYLTFHATWVAVEMIVEPVVLGTVPFYKSLKPALEKYGAAYNGRAKRNCP
jgi:hypothetical protein